MTCPCPTPPPAPETPAFVSPFDNRAALLAIAADSAALCVGSTSRLGLEAFVSRVRAHLEVAR